MTDDLTNIVFQYNGRKYTFLVSVFSDNEETNKVALNNTDIEHFEYVNQMNMPVLTGSIIYVDKYGQIDHFISKPVTYMRVTLAEMTQKFSGNVTIEKINDQRKFEHVFIVQHIQILERSKQIVKYKLSICSINIINCLKNISFSNYDREPEDVYDILGACIGDCDLNLGTNYNIVKSGIKINYITNGNDTLFTILPYLLNKTLYYKDKITKFQYLYYNETLKNYNFFDITNKNTIIGIHNFVISFFDTNAESMTAQEAANIATITKFPATERILNTGDQEFTTYSLNSNSFEDHAFKSTQILDYMNSNLIDEEKPTKYYKFNTNIDLTRRHAFWNNNFNLYSTFESEMLEDNALVLNVVGDVLRKPGSIATITTDRNMRLLNSSGRKEMKTLKNKYLQFEGEWMILKVRHIIENGTYKQNVVLNRNFILPEK